MTLEEKYKRPAFAACSKCGEHGAIVFTDGSWSESILSIESGKKILQNLIASGKLSSDDAQRIEDQLACSDLENTDEQLRARYLLQIVDFTLEKIESIRHFKQN